MKKSLPLENLGMEVRFSRNWAINHMRTKMRWSLGQLVVRSSFEEKKRPFGIWLDHFYIRIIYSSYSIALVRLVERASYLWSVLGETVSLMRLPAKRTHVTSAQGPISILLYKRTKSTSPFYISRNFGVFGLFACSAGLFLHICELFFSPHYAKKKYTYSCVSGSLPKKIRVGRWAELLY